MAASQLEEQMGLCTTQAFKTICVMLARATNKHLHQSDGNRQVDWKSYGRELLQVCADFVKGDGKVLALSFLNSFNWFRSKREKSYEDPFSKIPIDLARTYAKNMIKAGVPFTQHDRSSSTRTNLAILPVNDLEHL